MYTHGILPKMIHFLAQLLLQLLQLLPTHARVKMYA
jgi:hypothetical protein